MKAYKTEHKIVGTDEHGDCVNPEYDSVDIVRLAWCNVSIIFGYMTDCIFSGSELRLLSMHSGNNDYYKVVRKS